MASLTTRRFVFSFFAILVWLCYYSCQYSKGVHKDVATGLIAIYNGLATDAVYLADANGNKKTSNKVIWGDAVKVVATDVDFWQETAGKVYPACSLIVKDATGNTLLQIDDLFEDQKNGMPAAEATQLSATLTTGSPMEAGTTYQLQVTFFDRKKPEHKIQSDVNLVLLQPEQ